MLLAIDVGNTKTVLGLFEGEELRDTWYFDSPFVSTEADAHTQLDFAETAAAAFGAVIDAAAISCVVASRTAAWCDAISNRFGIRTTVCTGDFGLEPDLYTYRPSAYHLMGWDALGEMGRKFLESDSEERQVFYIWGHSYELDYYDTWSNFEEFCRLIANRDDIFYGTNREVLLGE